MSTRERMVETAVRLFQRHGYRATTWRQLVKEAGTPWGSVHHHFPGGKEELGVAAIDLGADAVAVLIDHCFATEESPAAAVETWFRLSAGLMQANELESGCPVATVALETTPYSPALSAASRRAFERWEEMVAERLGAAGLEREIARELAGTTLTLLEGAFVRARVHGSTEPLESAGAQAAALIAAAAARR